MNKLDYSSLPEDSDAGKLEHPASLSWVLFTFFFSNGIVSGENIL